MSRLPWLAAGLLTLVLGPTSNGQDPKSTPVLIYVTLPADAKLTVDGVAVKQTGPERRLITPPIKFGELGKYTLTATYTKDGKTVSVVKVITIEGGKVTKVDLTQEKPAAVDPKKVNPPMPPKKDEPKKVDPPKNEEPKKVDPPKKNDEPKKVDPPKKDEKKVDPPVPPKKDEPKKVDPPVPPKKDESKKEPKLEFPYNPTPQKVVDEILKLAAVKEGDIVYDLGCGDGRIAITAIKNSKAKKAIGVELSPERVKLAKHNVEKAGLADRVEIKEGDPSVLTDISEATVVSLNLLPEINEKLKPLLRKALKPGTRIVSLDFDMGEDWKPEKDVPVKGEDGKERTLYLWTIPKADPKVDAPKRKLPIPFEKDRPPAPKVKPIPFDRELPPAPREKPALRDGNEPAKKTESSANFQSEEAAIKVPYLPTPPMVVEAMLKLAGVKEGDVVYDLGCGDGRIVVAAVKDFKAKKGVGVDIDPDRIKESNAAAQVAGVSDKVEFKQGDVLKVDSVAEANVVALYLFPEVNERLQPMLQKTLKPGSRVVSHDFLMKEDWKPEKEVSVKDAKGQEHSIYLWTIK